jgi:predicted enzyme related to lactoylglutathione lyase
MSTATEIVTGVDFAAIPTQNFDEAIRFYGETLGLRRSVCIPERGFAEFETGNLTLSVIETAKMGMEFHPNRNAIALHVDDMDAARATLTERGVAFQGDTFDTSVCYMSFFSDPDGNALMLHHRYTPRNTE